MSSPQAESHLVPGATILNVATSETAVLDEKSTARFPDGTIWPRSEVISKWRASKVGMPPAGKRSRKPPLPGKALPGEPGLIAGRVRLSDAMESLASERPIFHSEADFQFALAQTIVALDKKIQVRLERPIVFDGQSVYLDLLCSHEDSHTAIELKYFTQKWTGTVGDEPFHVKQHGTRDLARRHYVHDVTRMEAFASTGHGNGLAVMLTNDPQLWLPAKRQNTRDINFHINEGRTLSGHLAWGPEDHPLYGADLDGCHVARWGDYSARTDDFQLRYLLLEAESKKEGAARA